MSEQNKKELFQSFLSNTKEVQQQNNRKDNSPITGQVKKKKKKGKKRKGAPPPDRQCNLENEHSLGSQID